MKARFCRTTVRLVVSVTCVLAAMALSTQAHAVDGCKVLLCMAGSWRNISECEPTVRQALRDLARGRTWPRCEMSGDSQSANQPISPEECPEQYRSQSFVDGEAVYGCPFVGAILVVVQGQPWSRTWWSPSGEAVVEWLPAAQAAFADSPGSMDGQFASDHAAWFQRLQSRQSAAGAPTADAGPVTGH